MASNKRIHEDDTIRNSLKKSRKDNGALSSILTFGLISYPDLLDELPTIISGLDKNQSIEIHMISNHELRNFLSILFDLLPLEYRPNNGWSKLKTVTSLSGYIMSHLLESKSIVQPGDLSPSQTLSVRLTTFLLDMVRDIPTLRLELSALLENILLNRSVNIGELENEEVKEKLEKLFLLLGLESSPDDDDDYHIPKQKSQIISETLEHIIKLFNVFEKYDKKILKEKAIELQSTSIPNKQINETASGSQSLDSEGNSSDSDDSNNDETKADIR